MDMTDHLHVISCSLSTEEPPNISYPRGAYSNIYNVMTNYSWNNGQKMLEVPAEDNYHTH